MKRILVVDDDRMLADTLREMILACVHGATEVEVATSGARAAAVLDSGAGFDLVICDLVMPGIGGIELYRRLEQSGSPLARRLIFVTGGAFTESAAAFVASARIPCLHKPFDLAQLRKMLSAALDAREP